MKTLIIEDDAAARRILAKAAESLGHEVTACSEAQAAWEAFKQSGHPLVMADWLLPGLDGLELCRRIRRAPRGHGSVILVVTARDRLEDLEAILQAGADDYLAKPIDVDLLRIRLRIAEHRARGRQHRLHAEQKRRRYVLKLEEQKQELARRTSEIAVLNEMGDLLQACNSEDEVVAAATQLARAALPGESGGLWLLLGRQALLELVMVWGEAPPREGVFGKDDCWALRRGQPHLVEEVSGGPRCAHLDRAAPAGSLCVPMMAQGKALGVLHVQSGAQGLAAPSEQLAVAVAEKVASALSRCRLQDDMRRKCMIDPATGLLNRPSMEISLVREVHRARRHRSSLSMILFSLATATPQTAAAALGEAELRRLSKLLLDRIRGGDMACRHADHTISVIFPHAPVAAACRRAETLQRLFTELDPRFERLAPSVAVAGLPDHASTAADLLRAADQALRQAVANGTGQVQVASPAPGAGEWVPRPTNGGSAPR